MVFIRKESLDAASNESLINRGPAPARPEPSISWHAAQVAKSARPAAIFSALVSTLRMAAGSTWGFAAQPTKPTSPTNPANPTKVSSADRGLDQFFARTRLRVGEADAKFIVLIPFQVVRADFLMSYLGFICLLVYRKPAVFEPMHTNAVDKCMPESIRCSHLL